MPRRHSRRPAPPPPLSRGGSETVEVKRAGEFHVRRLTGVTATKDYTCPGCHRPVPMGSAHVVVWPVEKALLSASALDERRHWHTTCWSRNP